MDQTHQDDRAAARDRGVEGAVLDPETLDGLLQRVVQLAVRTVPGAYTVSITVKHHAGYRTWNSTGEAALAIDEAQYADDDGPCLHGMRTGEQLAATLSVMAERWPGVAARAQEVGVRGVLSTPLIGDGETALGALNVYTGDERRFGDEELMTARLLGEQTTILLQSALALTSASQLNDQLRQAVASREIIGEAKGILMEREGCTRDQAFDILRRASQRENRKLRELAEELVLRVEARRQAPGAVIH